MKYLTKAAGEIAISLIDIYRKVHHIDFIQAEEAKFGQCHIDVSKVPIGAYLIKFKFENGKTTYRQMMKK